MRIFLAAPFSGYLENQETQDQACLAPSLKNFLTHLESAFLGEGHSVFLAHRREGFGANLWPPAKCVPFDMLEMQLADCVVAFPEQSYGVHIELGWATAMDKPIILVLRKGLDSTSPLLTGLEAVSRCTKVEVPADILANEVAQQELGTCLLQLLVCLPSPTETRRAFAFLSTSFGFGPVSKAVSIAQELKIQAPNLALHYFGDGIDYDFAKKSHVFDRLFKVDTDQRDVLTDLVPKLTAYKAVFSVINLGILPLWRQVYPPLYFVDSLAWMWPDIPDGLSNVRTYFVQDYLLPSSRVQQWETKVPLKLVPPIETASTWKVAVPPKREKRLVVNFSGCFNPFVDIDFFQQYVQLFTTLVLKSAPARYDEIIFCCNEHLLETIQESVKGNCAVQAGHFAHDDFLKLIASAELLISAPGITTTLETITLETPVCFLLPQNYSQALLSEHYRESLGDASCMALSRFGEEYRITPSLPEEEGVALALRHVREILLTHQQQIAGMLEAFLSSSPIAGLENLRKNISHAWEISGQSAIVEHTLSMLNDKSRQPPRKLSDIHMLTKSLAVRHEPESRIYTT